MFARVFSFSQRSASGNGLLKASFQDASRVPVARTDFLEVYP
jgi:hypothetical protein